VAGKGEKFPFALVVIQGIYTLPKSQ